jgi:hypothetical protein
MRELAPNARDETRTEHGGRVMESAAEAGCA